MAVCTNLERIESSLSNPISDIDKLGIETLIVRADYQFNLDNLIKQLDICPCSIVTDKAIPEDIIDKNKHRIPELIYFSDDSHDPSFVLSCIQKGINIALASKKTEEEVNKYKIDYLDIEQNINIVPKVKLEDIEELRFIKTNKIFYKSNKFYFMEEKLFLAKWLSLPTNLFHLLIMLSCKFLITKSFGKKKTTFI